jgi:3-oxoacyl-[acyl-carrier protein] reductase
MPEHLSGYSAVVTGGGRGIGRAIALAFARSGAQVLVVARTESEVQSVAQEIRDLGLQAASLAADVATSGGAERAVSECIKVWGRIDILVTSAGVLGPVGMAWETDEAEWEQAVRVNLLGTYFCARAALRRMCPRRSGVIITLSGGGASGPRPNFSAYAASKAAVVRLTETLADEAQPYGVRVNAIAPGMVETRMLDELEAAGDRAGQERETVRRVRSEGKTASPESAAELAVFLASDAARNLTGKLVSAVHDSWRTWTPQQISSMNAKPWFTLRRLDRHTLSQIGVEQTEQ